MKRDYEEGKISVLTLYKRMDEGLMKCKNIHLRNKIKRKPKNEKREIKADKGKHREYNIGNEYTKKRHMLTKKKSIRK